MKKDKKDGDLSELSAKLDQITKLLALNLVKDMKKQKEQIAFLSSAGFQPKQIAEMLSTSANTVSVALHSIRKEKDIADTERSDPKSGGSVKPENEGEIAEKK